MHLLIIVVDLLYFVLAPYFGFLFEEFIVFLIGVLVGDEVSFYKIYLFFGFEILCVVLVNLLE